ncbi:MAG: 2-hydroxyacyl-CoA dehydratase [Spirochaetes bacterium]|nr:2-hydroxyacyl-CoA dehydratase [Spirochaetota bacterium]
MINQSKIAEIFDEVIASPENRLLEQDIDEGKIPIGYTCSYVPEVLLSVDRLVPVRMRAPGIAGTEIADNYLSSVICSYTRSILEFALDDRYDFLRGWVFAASCDHMRRLYDNLVYIKKPAFAHILDVPHKINEAGLAWYTDEIQDLADRLSKQFEADMSDAAVSAAIRERNDFTALLSSIHELRKIDPPPITGTEFHRILTAAQVSPMHMIIPHIRETLDELRQREGGSYRARLMMVGGELDDPEYIKVVESQGGVVVADRFCTGSIPGLEPIEMKGDPIRTIAEHTFKKTICPRMMADFESRVQAIIDVFRDYRVDGVIIEFVKFCDIWGVESSPLVSAIRDAGIPVLKLEREYRLSGEGQIRTRVQAFLESMGK